MSAPPPLSSWSPLSAVHAELLDDLHAFVRAEQDAANRRLMEIWQQPLARKLAQGRTQGSVRIVAGPAPNTLWAHTDESESNFREGDILCLHQGDAQEPLARELTFEYEDEHRWLLRGRKALLAFADYAGGVCYADPDAFDLMRYYRQTLDEIGDSPSGREILLPLLAGETPLEFDERDMNDAESIARAAGCNPRQAAAVAWAHGALQLACIQGPPGTGKTRVLALIAHLAVARGERVLLTSHTHTAIDHALNKIHEHGVPLVKIGRIAHASGLNPAIARYASFDAWEERPTDGRSGYVVGATPFATCAPHFDRIEFDCVLFDEASQITAPLALMAMRKGKRFIFIGDSKQLPPVLLACSVFDQQTHSIFTRLTAPQAEHCIMLDETYRMNRWLADWPSRTFYHGELRAAGANRERRLRLSAIPPRYAAVFDPEAALVFVPTLDRQARNRNRRDAALVADLCAVAIDGGLTPQQIGIVAPYRAQGRAIRLALEARLGRDAARHIVADTVERMQGQERELILVSLTTGDPSFLAAVAEFFFQPERLNVSITRAMTKLILIGPEAPDPAEFQPETLRLWLTQYRDLLAACRRAAV